MNRRNFLKLSSGGVLIAAAPAIIREGFAMPVKVARPQLAYGDFWLNASTGDVSTFNGKDWEVVSLATEIKCDFIEQRVIIRAPQNEAGNIKTMDMTIRRPDYASRIKMDDLFTVKSSRT